MEFVKSFTPSDFQAKNLHRQFHLILTVVVIKTQKNERKWRNLHHWPKNLHCHRQWRQGQISPLLRNNKEHMRWGGALDPTGSQALPCLRLNGTRQVYNAAKRNWYAARVNSLFYLFKKKKIQRISRNISNFHPCHFIILIISLVVLFFNATSLLFQPIALRLRDLPFNTLPLKKRAGPWAIFKCQ